LLIWLEQVDNVFSSALKGAEQFGQAARVEVASKTLQVLATAIVLLKWPDLMALYAMLLLVALVRLVAKIFVASRLLELSNLRPSLAGAPVILNFAKWGWLQGIGGVLFGVADRILVGSLLGPASLAYYSIASQLALQIHALTAAGVSVIFPMVSRKLEDRGEFSLWRVAKVTMVASTLLSSSLAMMLFLLGPLILHAWIGGSAASGSAQILPWLIAAYCVLALNVVPYYLLLAMGRIRFISLTVLVSGALAMIAMALTIPTFGLIGAPAGRGLYAILSLALAFPLMRHFLKERNAQLQSRLLNTTSESELAR
jgi:O-antigen/teichoic acid export membrane protein